MEIEEAYKKAAKKIQLHFNAKRKAIEKQYGEANASKISPRSCAIDRKSFCMSGQQLYAATVPSNPETNSAHSKPSVDVIVVPQVKEKITAQKKTSIQSTVTLSASNGQTGVTGISIMTDSHIHQTRHKQRNSIRIMQRKQIRKYINQGGLDALRAIFDPGGSTERKSQQILQLSTLILFNEYTPKAYRLSNIDSSDRLYARLYASVNVQEAIPRQTDK